MAGARKVPDPFPDLASSLGAGADRFWAGIDGPRAAARSRARAEIAVRLLAGASISGGRLLDVGCGPGWAMETFRSAGFEVRGVDASPAAVDLARSRGLASEVMDVEEGVLPGGFRVVAALEVLEHLRDPLGALETMARALSPGGRLLVSLPNELHLPRRLAVLAGRPGLAGHRQFGGHDDPHLRHFTPRESERLFRAGGFQVRARGWEGLAPPRWRFLRGVSGALAALRPSLFGLAGVYLLDREGLDGPEEAS